MSETLKHCSTARVPALRTHKNAHVLLQRRNWPLPRGQHFQGGFCTLRERRMREPRVHRSAQDTVDAQQSSSPGSGRRHHCEDSDKKKRGGGRLQRREVALTLTGTRAYFRAVEKELSRTTKSWRRLSRCVCRRLFLEVVWERRSQKPVPLDVACCFHSQESHIVA